MQLYNAVYIFDCRNLQNLKSFFLKEPCVLKPQAINVLEPMMKTAGHEFSSSKNCEHSSANPQSDLTTAEKLEFHS